MSNMIIVNFGTIKETNRFKQYALQSNFVGQDVLEKKFSSLPFQRGRRFRTHGSQKVLTFWGLPDSEFRRRRKRFKKWYTDAISKDYPHCVYLTGHHNGFQMWGGPSSSHIKLYMRRYEKRRKRFSYRVDGRKRDRADIDLSLFQQNCLIVIGMGCNICTGSASLHYQRYFKNKARKPIILGYNNSIGVPKTEAKSVVIPFFYYIDNFIKKLPEQNSGSPAPTNKILEYLYEKNSKEILKAWGYANRKSRRYYFNVARARDKNGAFYRFRYNRSKKKIVLKKA